MSSTGDSHRTPTSTQPGNKASKPSRRGAKNTSHADEQSTPLHHSLRGNGRVVWLEKPSSQEGAPRVHISATVGAARRPAIDANRHCYAESGMDEPLQTSMVRRGSRARSWHRQPVVVPRRETVLCVHGSSKVSKTPQVLLDVSGASAIPAEVIASRPPRRSATSSATSTPLRNSSRLRIDCPPDGVGAVPRRAASSRKVGIFRTGLQQVRRQNIYKQNRSLTWPRDAPQPRAQ